MRRVAPPMSLSLLDTLSCAFGAVIVLAMIFSALVKSQPAVERQNFLFTHAEIAPVAPCESWTDRLPNLWLTFHLYRETRGGQAEHLASWFRDAPLAPPGQQLPAWIQADSFMTTHEGRPEADVTPEAPAFSNLVINRPEAGRYWILLTVLIGSADVLAEECRLVLQADLGSPGNKRPTFSKDMSPDRVFNQQIYIPSSDLPAPLSQAVESGTIVWFDELTLE